MASKIITFALFLCINQLVAAENVEQLKSQSIKKLSQDYKAIHEMRQEMIAEMKRRLANIDAIIKTKNDFAEVTLLEGIQSEIKNTAAGYEDSSMLLLNEDRKTPIKECIKNTTSSALVEGRATYDSYKAAAEALKKQAEKNEYVEMHQWEEDYKNVFWTFDQAGTRVEDEIRKTNNENFIKAMMANYEKIVEEVQTVVTSIVPRLNAIHFELEKSLFNLVFDYKAVGARVLEKSVKNIENCFDPKYLDA